jgi:hypothetical protein
MAKKEKKEAKFTLKKIPLPKDLSIFLSKNDQDPARYPSYYPANASPSIQGFDNTNLKTQEVDEYM